MINDYVVNIINEACFLVTNQLVQTNIHWQW